MGWLQQHGRVDPRLPILFLPLAVILSSAIGTVLMSKHRRVRRNGRVALTRPTGRPGISRLIFTASVLWILGMNVSSGHVTLHSLGVSPEVPSFAAFLAGLAFYAAFWGASTWAARRLGVEEQLSDLGVQALALLMPRSRSEKMIAWLAIVLMNPVFEETLFRGLLVHHLGEVSGHIGLAMAIGLVANSVNHLYQGARLMLFHAAFYGCAVAILYSPLGLVGAIGFHFGGDLIPIALFRRELRRYRLRHSAVALAAPSSRIR